MAKSLRQSIRDPDYSESYSETFLDMFVATQIKVLREQRGLTQGALAELIGTKQGAISRLENANYSRWSIGSLKRLARAFRVRLHISFETFGSLPEEVVAMSQESLQRVAREDDSCIFPENTRKKILRVTDIGDFKLSQKAAQSMSGASENAIQQPEDLEFLYVDGRGYAAARSANG